jgi:hypothetical protein
LDVALQEEVFLYDMLSAATYWDGIQVRDRLLKNWLAANEQ